MSHFFMSRQNIHINLEEFQYEIVSLVKFEGFQIFRYNYNTFLRKRVLKEVLQLAKKRYTRL